MGDKRRSTCIECGGHRDDVGTISWKGNCIACAKKKGARAIESLAYHRGRDFARWRAGHAAAVGAIFPDERRPPGVPRLNRNQQAETRKSGHWAKVSRARLAYANGECEIRLPGCVKIAASVHLNPALGGNHRLATFEDCRAACVVCHGYIHATVKPEETIAQLDAVPPAA